MAGKLVLSTLNDDTGVLNVQNGMTGIAKAWVNYNPNTQTIINSFNVSSVTYVGTGNYTVNFTTAMPNSNFSVNTTAGGSDGSRSIAATAGERTTTSAKIYMCLSGDYSFTNGPYVGLVVFSS